MLFIKSLDIVVARSNMCNIVIYEYYVIYTSCYYVFI